MLLRLLIGSMLMWRVVRAARPVRDAGPLAQDMPQTSRRRRRAGERRRGRAGHFCIHNSVAFRIVRMEHAQAQAVLLHEGSHVAHGDFYVLLLAAINRAVFWFNPFAWWLFVRLADLGRSGQRRRGYCGTERPRPLCRHSSRRREQRPAPARGPHHGAAQHSAPARTSASWRRPRCRQG